MTRRFHRLASRAGFFLLTLRASTQALSFLTRVSEYKFQPPLHRARGAAAYLRIGIRHIRRGEGRSEASGSGGVGVRLEGASKDSGLQRWIWFRSLVRASHDTGSASTGRLSLPRRTGSGNRTDQPGFFLGWCNRSATIRNTCAFTPKPTCEL